MPEQNAKERGRGKKRRGEVECGTNARRNEDLQAAGDDLRQPGALDAG